MNFGQLGLSQDLVQVVGELGYETPTTVQSQAIPLLLKGQDLIAQSATGSGKTAAFALPILQKLDMERRELQALVLCPTRELGAQVAREFRRLGRRLPGLHVLVVSGGLPIGPQIESLERGAHIVVGTPGRCLDHLLRKTISFSEVKTVVLDEADRMLDMGFEEDMEKLLGALNRKRQTVLFSATFPQEIEKISRAYQKQPQRVTVESADENKPKIEQLVYVCPPEQKSSAVIGVLEHYQPHSSIVFCNTKLAVARLARELVDAGIRAVEIHGDRLQSERDRAMAKFRNGTARVLVATDVAARGIDIQGLDAVICFEPTPQPEVHTHRIGRTGRAGREGLAILLITEQERHRFDQIKEHTGGKFLFRSLDDLGRGGSEIRSKSNGEIERANPSTAAPPVAMETLWISGGRKQKVRPGDLLGALTGEAGRLRADQVGKIEIHDNFSYVAIHQSESARVINELRNGQIKGRKFRVERVR